MPTYNKEEMDDYVKQKLERYALDHHTKKISESQRKIIEGEAVKEFIREKKVIPKASEDCSSYKVQFHTTQKLEPDQIPEFKRNMKELYPDVVFLDSICNPEGVVVFKSKKQEELLKQGITIPDQVKLLQKPKVPIQVQRQHEKVHAEVQAFKNSDERFKRARQELDKKQQK